MNERKLLLGGGGSAEQEHVVLECFADWLDASDLVLYLPIAAATPGPAHFEWVSSALAPFDVRHIDMWITLTDHTVDELDRYKAIFIGGGNTYRLLQQVRMTGFGTALIDFAERRILYGGSAGAIVCGSDIDTCAHMDENVVGLTDTTGLDLVGGTSIWCHYASEDDSLIQAYVERTELTTIALSETSGLWVQGAGHYIPLGSGPVYRFSPAGKSPLIE